MVQEINWDNFRAKFSSNKQAAFERLCYLLFCKEFNKGTGIFRFRNHAGIETDPIEKDGRVIGWQAKFYSTRLSEHKQDFIDSINTTTTRHPTVNKIIFYTNQEFGQGAKKTDPQYNESMPSYANHVWATDFTEILFHGKKVYVSTIIDLFTRQLMGVHVAVRKGSALAVQTLANALFHHPKPVLFHSDNGSEYKAHAFVGTLENCGITISRSRPGCPWENGYQESFYDKFKVDLGDPNRFKTLGELIAEIYGTLWQYNHTRIHSALKMPPSVFAEKIAA